MAATTATPQRRAVITGLGAVTPLGTGVDTFWTHLTAGERGIRPITKFNPEGLRNEKAGEIRDWSFAPSDFNLADAPDEAAQFLLQAASQAFADAGLERHFCPSDIDPHTGTVLATNFAGMTAWDAYMNSVLDGAPDAAAFSGFGFDHALGQVARVFGMGGPCSVTSMACASGTAAVGIARDEIVRGNAEVMLAGGYDSLSPTLLSGLSLLRTITDDDLRPFSANRSGTLFGEGSAALVVESYEHAVRRGTKIYCEVLGHWQNNNAYHLTAPDSGGAGMARALSKALEVSGVDPAAIDHINAHGTGTEYHDVAETEAIKTVLGDHAYEVTVVSIKGALSHLMGAAGAIEAVTTALSIAHQRVPPTTNYSEPDPECDLDYVTGGAREQQIRNAASISAGIGGDNACVVFGAVPENNQ